MKRTAAKAVCLSKLGTCEGRSINLSRARVRLYLFFRAVLCWIIMWLARGNEHPETTSFIRNKSS